MEFIYNCLSFVVSKQVLGKDHPVLLENHIKVFIKVMQQIELELVHLGPFQVVHLSLARGFATFGILDLEVMDLGRYKLVFEDAVEICHTC
jgi:hypothetical protein